MSDTPRTDAKEESVEVEQLTYKDEAKVAWHFARELERELVRMTLRRDELQTLIDNEGYPSGADYEKLERELAEEKYQHHLTRGVADLAIKHRDEAERENAQLRDALKWAESYVPKRSDCETRRMIESLSA